jgi:hypothetical protein
MAGSDIYKLAEYMEKLSKRTIQKFRAQMGIQQVQPPPPPKKPAAPRTTEPKKKTNMDEKSDGEEEEDE